MVKISLLPTLTEADCYSVFIFQEIFFAPSKRSSNTDTQNFGVK